MLNHTNRRLAASVPIEVSIDACPITRRTRPFSLAREDAADASWRARAHAEHRTLLEAMQREFKHDKGIDYDPPAAEYDSAMYWHIHGVVSCHWNRAEEASRSYRESLRLAPSVPETASVLHALGKVYLGQGKFEVADPVLQLAEERAGSADRRHPSYRAVLSMLRLHAAAQRPSAAAAEASQQMAELFCDQVVELASLASIGGWGRASCRSVTAEWERSFARRGALSEQTRTAFRQRKYALLDAVLPARLFSGFVQPWYRWLASLGADEAARYLPNYEMRWLAKRQRFELLHEPVAEMLNVMLASLAAAVAGVQLVPSYAFPIRYPAGGFVEWHIDQKDNELSLSLQIEISPAEHGWPLYFVDYNTTVRPGSPPPKTIALDAWHVSTAAQLVALNNQGVLYKGQELVHYRPALPAGLELMQVVFAWRLPNEASCNG